MESKGFAPKPNVTAPNAAKAPNPALPKGGGAVRGIGEKFAANLVSGTGSLSIPIAVSPGRGGFGPEISVAYDSGGGNGPFGAGFRLSVPSISRKTERGLPEYEDHRDSDAFILSGAEDLVRCEVQPETEGITRYRPRVEGLFARIERVVEEGNVYWRTITKDNITSIFGQSAEARIADPKHPELVFSWLLERVEDAKGNVTLYEYKAEDLVNVSTAVTYEKQRHDGRSAMTNQYVKRIRYGNTVMGGDETFHFEVVFDYGEHDEETPTPTEATTWPCRQDPFSTYRARFDIRTYRLCRRVLMFHHFTELGEDPVLVRSTDFAYDENPTLTKMVSATQSGYIKTESGYTKKSLPPLEFEYAPREIHKTVKVFDDASMADLPGGVDEQTAQWADVDGEGISGILCQREGAWYYKQNLGEGMFTPARRLTSQPSIAAGGQAQLMDVGREGRPCLVQFSPNSPAGFHARTHEGGWGSFRPFASQPNVDFRDPNVRMIDLSGNGLDDVLVTNHCLHIWFPSLGVEGWDKAREMAKTYDQERGPSAVFADVSGAVFVADMTGDGLPDIVRIWNGNICYWPNLGYGQFGAKVQMANAPLFDDSHRFDARRIRFADIDGTGTTDIVYVGTNEILIAFNQAGNGFSAPERLTSFPTHDSASTVSVVDLLGNGTSCLVWSSPWRGVARPPMRYVDLMNGKKPYLMTSVTNNMGAETKFEYASSTKFYLEDLKSGKPWVTRLSFPVHVLVRTETYDAVRKVRFVSTYKYHHGYYDAAEREFRGFGLVEQFDTESFDGAHGKGLFADAPVVEEEFYLPPVMTKTWFHTGAYFDKGRISKQYAKEYYAGDTSAPELPDGVLPSGLSAKDIREACRALKGQMLRQEVYALDGTVAESHPYKVTEVCPAILPVQASKPNRYGSFFAYVRESVDVHYERDANDPRMVHTLALVVDEYGQVTKSASIAYARRSIPTEYPEQGLLATLTETEVINKANEADWYRLGVPHQTKTYQLTGISATQSALLTFAAVQSAASEADAIAYEDTPTGTTLQKRLVEHVKQKYYDKDSLATTPVALAFGAVDALALPYQTYALAFTPGLLTDAYAGRTPPIDVSAVTALLLSSAGGYIEEDDVYWLPTGREVFDPEQFYLPVEVIDVFSNSTVITYDDHSLLVEAVEDALGNTIEVENDYRVLGPVLVTDPNGNRGAAKIDELGMVIATAVMGKVGGSDGDTLEDPTTTFEYDLERWLSDGKPNVVHNAVREKHGDSGSPWQHSYTYLDGLGGELMKKVQAEPGLAPVRDEETGALVMEEGELVLETASPRWVGTGRVVLDNKGNPIKKYEPFFSATHEYEDEAILVEWGVTPILRYDALGRLIRTDMPDGSVSRVEFTPWEQSTFDGNDTVLETDNAWYAARQSAATPTPSTQDQRAATLTAAHAGTAAVVVFDVLGRPIAGIEDNGGTDQYDTRAQLDIEGNPVTITDARGNIPAENIFDMLGRTLYTVSCDAGARWSFMNAMGNPIRAWDSRDHVIRSVYDALQRRTELWVKAGAADEVLAEQTIYGESQTDPEVENLRGKVYQSKDGAGVVTNVSYDFKGNLLSSQRQLAVAYSTQLDWSDTVTLETETFVQTIEYDALNRPTSITMPDSSEILPIYNEAGLLESVTAHVRGATGLTTFVDDIDYDAKGQREKIVYGNGVYTEYEYDEFTFRVKRIKTTRDSDDEILQDLRYTYDAVGNIVEMADLAHETFYHGGHEIKAVWKYEYDALYRLTYGTGREHVGTNDDIQQDENGFPLVNGANPNDPSAMRNYEEWFEYDQVGNIVKMIHDAQSSVGDWTRHYHIAETSNRLLDTSLPGDDEEDEEYSGLYEHDEHGNMKKMPHLSDGIEWDFKDQMRHVDKGGGGDVYFVYDASGQRIRKVWEHSGIVEERIYLGGFELYRRHEGGDVVLERETLHIMDDAQRIAMIETKTIDEAADPFTITPRIRYQLGNHLGSAMLELDHEGLVISYEEYHPYGTSAYRAVDDSIEVSAKRYRYTGKERDEETGLYYHGARYYACWLARWTAADPAGMVDGVNLYRAMRNSPIQLTDPSGTDPALPNDTRTVEQRNESYSYRYAEFIGKIKDYTPAIARPTISAPTAEENEFTQEWNAQLAGYNGNAAAQKEHFPQAYEYSVWKAQQLREESVRQEALEAGVSVREIEATHKAIEFVNVAMMVLPELAVPAQVAETSSVRMALRSERLNAASKAPVPRGSKQSFRGAVPDPIPISPPEEGQVIPGQPIGRYNANVFAGHGFQPKRSFIVPDGTDLLVPQLDDFEYALPEYWGQQIEATGEIPLNLKVDYFGPGQSAPDLILTRPVGLETSPTSTTVNAPTYLSDMLQPHMGVCMWAACRRPLPLPK